MDENERKKMDEIYKEWLSRLAPASNEEIIGLAEKMWVDSKLRTVFERVGYDGDMTEAEEAAVDEAIDTYRQGQFWDRDDLHLALAPCLVRQLAAKMIDRLDCPKVKMFLESRKVLRGGGAIKMAPTTVDEVLNLARAMRNEPEIWSIFKRIPPGPLGAATEGDVQQIEIYKYKYMRKYGLYNSDIRVLNEAGWLLRSLAHGEIESLEKPEVLARIRRNTFIAK